jgi:hypothetical protein
MAAAGILLGAALCFRAYNSFLSQGLGKDGLFQVLIGLVCVYGAGISRRLYLSDDGVVREMRSWGRILRKILLWKDIRHVTLAFRGNRMMAFFEAGATGWKVPFLKDQKGEVLDVLDEYIPEVGVDIIGK